MTDEIITEVFASPAPKYFTKSSPVALVVVTVFSSLIPNNLDVSLICWSFKPPP